MTMTTAARRLPSVLLCIAFAVTGGCVQVPSRPVATRVPEAQTATPPLLGDLVAPPQVVPADAPAIPREFRGVWVAAVNNLDWPTRPGLAPEVQRAELIAILDRAVSLGLNAVILQVRPSGDALYPSPYEPWSEYLTGRMGQGPEPFYDPLDFAVREAHRRGLELHAWFNPFRARDPSARQPASPDHISRAKPELVRRYGSYTWMDPSEPAVQDQAVRVILDVARRYDVDGIHIDDYFYPYRENDARGRTLPFPDDANYNRYRVAGGTMGRSDWRRSNVDRFVERLYGELKSARPKVKFGISPFGIWRPGHPSQIRGLDAYEEIYADARKWLNRGWVDYFVPQLYWPVDQTPQAFPVLLDWWVEENHAGRHIWPGSFTDRVSEGRWPAGEIVRQIQTTRGTPGATGNVFFRMRSLMSTRNGLAESLVASPYASPALVPPSPWLDRSAPARPTVTVQWWSTTQASLALAPLGGEPVFLWTVRWRTELGWNTRVIPGWQRETILGNAPEQIVVTAIGRTGNESAPVVVRQGDIS